MRKILIVVIVVLAMVACSTSSETNQDIITVTIEPQRFFLEQLVGDKYKVNTLVPVGVSPEAYEPAPRTMLELGKSKAYFKVGFVGFENVWTKKLKANNPNIEIVDCSLGIELLRDATHSHQYGHVDPKENPHFVNADPHIWSSARNAVLFSKNMLDALIKIDPENSFFYEENYQALVDKIENTDELIKELLQGIVSRSFIIYHPALSYFARDYDLTQYSVEFEGKSPSPAQMKELIDLAKKKDIKAVFIQQEFDVKNTKVIADELGATPHVINPLAYEWDTELIKIAEFLSK